MAALQSELTNQAHPARHARRRAEDPEVTDETWAEAARGQFRGTVIVGRDLLEI
ncbi:MAG: hypothetical protein ACRD3V_07030 [Vicinamibacteria bacterium]